MYQYSNSSQVYLASVLKLMRNCITGTFQTMHKKYNLILLSLLPWVCFSIYKCHSQTDIMQYMYNQCISWLKCYVASRAFVSLKQKCPISWRWSLYKLCCPMHWNTVYMYHIFCCFHISMQLITVIFMCSFWQAKVYVRVNTSMTVLQ